MFEQDVAGLIKALRANKNDEASVIHHALEETRKEIRSKDIEIKAAAVLKLVYLEMLGQSIAFASFAIVECMSSTKYHIKTIGYLAASQCFDKETEVAVLVVNLVKKDLLSPPTSVFSSSPSSMTVAHLLSTLSAVSLLLTPPLARDLAPDLISMLSHSRPQVRRQTVLTMWRVVRAWPGVIELGSANEDRGDDPWIERLRERLADQDNGVVSATVNLICELARKDPRPYLPLAPELFGLLTASTNNWMLIKIIKLFAVLTPEEPRLVKKLVPPLTDLIETTPAMSLLYECIQTSIVGGMLNGTREGEALATTCVDKLKSFLEDADQNLRYIALVALVKILPTHPHLVSVHYDIIMKCVDDPDISIRLRALDLVEGMVDRRTLQPIVQRLMTHLRPTSSTTTATAALRQQQASTSASAADAPAPVILSNEYRTSLVALILRMCSSATYAHVANFEWYLDVLVELAYLSLRLSSEGANTISLGKRLRDQFVDVVARVRAIRPYAVKKCAALLGDESFLEFGDGAEVCEVLGAAAWICGEYCLELQDPRPVIASLFGSSSSTLPIPAHILCLYIHNGVKVYASWLQRLSQPDVWDESSLVQIRSVTGALEAQLAEKASSSDVELQERAAELGQLLELVLHGLDAPQPLPAPRDADADGEEEQETGFGGLDEAGGFAGPKLPPSSLGLLAPLFFSHELNPVNPKAQSLVALPEGLDLDAFIVPDASTSRLENLEIEDGEERGGQRDEFGRLIGGAVVGRGEEETPIRRKKGKGKAVDSAGSKKSKRKEVVADPEEMARLKAERLERQRDDPYYIGNSSAPPTPAADDDHEVDSIPIVQLSLDFATPVRRPPSPPPRVPTPPPVHIDVDGELPEGAELGRAPVLNLVNVEETEKPQLEEERRASEVGVKKVVKKVTPKGSKKKKAAATPSPS